MAKENERSGATKLSVGETFFDPRRIYSVEDWLFRVNLYYETLLCMTGPNGVNAGEAEMEVMLATLNMINWGECLLPGSRIGYEMREDGEIHPYAIEPKTRYIS